VRASEIASAASVVTPVIGFFAELPQMEVALKSRESATARDAIEGALQCKTRSFAKPRGT
jgi:hypothetical protein